MKLVNGILFCLFMSGAGVAVVAQGGDDSDATETEDIQCAEDTALTCDGKHSTGCVAGEANYKQFKLDDGSLLPIHQIKESSGGFHCDCDLGWTGLKCKRKFATCDLETDTADGKGENKCYHGGDCISGVLDRYGNPQLYCNCRRAGDRDGNKYVGKYCEIPATLCNDSGAVGGKFCLNDGTCTNNDDKPCDCANGYFGPHCEFEDEGLAVTTAATCTLKCKHGGTCTRGFEDLVQARYQYDQDGFYAEGDYQYCKCKDGFDGPLCQHDSSNLCNGGTCQHGGVCETIKSVDGTKTLSGCNCAKAGNATHSFTGRYCGHVSSNFCTKNGDQNGDPFCANGGECRPGGTHQACACKPGFTGPQCEHQIHTGEAEEAEDPKNQCNLQCMNKGKCRNGVKDVSVLNDLGFAVSHLNQSHIDFQHCVCPTGWVGPRCEFEVDHCEGGGHLCFHGSKCQKKGSSTTCQCDPAFTATSKVAGTYCQHKSTSYCTKSGNPDMGGQFDNAFCVNNGECKNILKDKSETFKGCKCPKGETGLYCEFSPEELAQQVAESGSTVSKEGNDLYGPSTAGKVGISVAVIAIFGAFLAFAIYARKNASAGKEIDSAESIAGTSTGTGGPVLDMGPERDAEGNELNNVEII